MNDTNKDHDDVVVVDDDDLLLGGVGEKKQQAKGGGATATPEGGSVVSSTSVSTLMQIEEDEYDLALEIKMEVEKRDDLRPLSDFLYAQHAIAAQGCKQTALDKIEGLQYFQEEYGIDASVGQGVDSIEQFLSIHPTSILMLNYHDAKSKDHVAICWDLGKVYPERNVFQADKAQHTDRHWRIHAKGWFYALQAQFPNLETCRNGNILLVEGANFGWDNFSTRCERQLQDELFLNYPGNPKKLMFYHTNVVLNSLVSMLKKFMPQHVQDTWHVGCVINGYDDSYEDSGYNPYALKRPPTLRDLFLQPTPEIAQINLLKDVETLLQERRENERTFRL